MQVGIGFCLFLSVLVVHGFPRDEMDNTSPFNTSFSDYLIPDNQFIPPVQVTTDFIILTNGGTTSIRGGKLAVSRREIMRVLERPTTNSLKKQAFPSLSSWSQETCCRQSGIQSRVRVINNLLEVQSRPCGSNYCEECRDALPICPILSIRHNACRSHHRSFMIQFCAVTCGFCIPGTVPPSFPTRPPSFPTRPPSFPTRPPSFPTRPPSFPTRPPSFPTRPPSFPTRPPIFPTRPPIFPTRPPIFPTRPPIFPTRPPIVTTQSTTTAAPTPSPFDRLVRAVSVYFHRPSPSLPINYKFGISEIPPGYPWQPASRLNDPNEVSVFYLYSEQTPSFNVPIYFCSIGQRTSEVWHLHYSGCQPGWRQQFVLYSSPVPSPDTPFFFIANTEEPVVRSRVHRGIRPCCGYENNRWFFFAAAPTTFQPLATNPSFSTPPTTDGFFTPPPFTTTTTRFPFPITSTPPRPTGNAPSSSFSRECLDSHNFFRAMHNVPPMEWDPALGSTSQRWANNLINSAPDHPDQLVPGAQRTRSWPHSESGIGRPRNTGENIAWDLSSDGSPAGESVLRWYAEIFDYNKNNPTSSSNGKPIGHYTQLLWRDSKRLGCSVAVTRRSRSQSSYTVAHYGPAGNIRYPSLGQNVQIYREQVPDPISGTCLSPQFCGSGMRCLGYGSSSCTCNGGLPRCSGSRGCIASCSGRSAGRTPWLGECQGQRLCYCSEQAVNGVRGAICT